MENESDEPAAVFQFKHEGLSDSCLDKLEQKHQAFEKSRATEDAESDKSLIRQGPSMEDTECLTRDTFKHPGRGGDYHHNGRRGIVRHRNDTSGHHGEFKIPNRPFRGRGSYRGRHGRGRSAPDYKAHPERWTEYSLEDIDVSNSSMKQAAFDFLHEQKQKREDEQREEGVNIESVACSKGLISFKKPVKNKTSDKLGEKKGSSYGRQTTAMEEDDAEAEKDDEEMATDSNIEMKDASVTETESNTSSGKRKMDLRDGVENMDKMEEAESDKTNTGFKFRKVSRKNIRNRPQKNGSDSD